MMHVSEITVYSSLTSENMSLPVPVTGGSRLFVAHMFVCSSAYILSPGGTPLCAFLLALPYL